jgi:hypothetical protein
MSEVLDLEASWSPTMYLLKTARQMNKANVAQAQAASKK